MKLTPEQAAQKLLNATSIVTVSKFQKDSGYRKNPLGNIKTYIVKQGNIYVKIMTTGKRSWGNRAIVDAVIRKNGRTPVIQHGNKFYLSLTLPIIELERIIYVNDRIATPQELDFLASFQKVKKENVVTCVDGKERVFRDFAIEPGAVFHYNKDIIEVI